MLLDYFPTLVTQIKINLYIFVMGGGGEKFSLPQRKQKTEKTHLKLNREKSMYQMKKQWEKLHIKLRLCNLMYPVLLLMLPEAVKMNCLARMIILWFMVLGRGKADKWSVHATSEEMTDERIPNFTGLWWGFT